MRMAWFYWVPEPVSRMPKCRNLTESAGPLRGSWSFLRLYQADQGAFLDAPDRSLLRAARLRIHIGRRMRAARGDVYDRLTVVGKDRFRGYAQGVGNTPENHVHPAVHPGTQPSIFVLQHGEAAEGAGRRPFP